jgi:hypothetical protein
MGDAVMTTTREDTFSAADDVNRAKAIVTTVWLALNSRDFAGTGGDDAGSVADTLMEALTRLSNAERKMGVHHA